MIHTPRLAARSDVAMGVQHGLRSLSCLRNLGEREGAARGLAAPGGAWEQDNSVQRLYKLAKKAFADRSVPSPQMVTKVLQAMCDVPLEELGLNDTTQRVNRVSCDSTSSDTWPEGITYLKVQEEPGLHVGIFCLPANSVIPLHDHPGMTVLSRLLYGKMHLRSYQWDEEEDMGTSSRQKGLAHITFDKILVGSDTTSVLFPTESNIHAFKAITDCAVLDVLSPPYNPQEGRECTYYQETFPGDIQESEDGLITGTAGTAVELRTCNPPHTFTVRQGPYYGLTVTDEC